MKKYLLLLSVLLAIGNYSYALPAQASAKPSDFG